MDGKPYCLMDDLGRKPTIFGNIHITFPNLISTYIPGSANGKLDEFILQIKAKAWST